MVTKTIDDIIEEQIGGFETERITHKMVREFIESLPAEVHQRFHTPEVIAYPIWYLSVNRRLDHVSDVFKSVDEEDVLKVHRYFTNKMVEQDFMEPPCIVDDRNIRSVSSIYLQKRVKELEEEISRLEKVAAQ